MLARLFQHHSIRFFDLLLSVSIFALIALFLSNSALAASDATTSPPGLPDMEKRAAACTGCHGPSGVATSGGYFPRIAGKPAGYLFNQLRHFRDNTRRFKGMNHLVAHLPDDYLQAFADYFAALELPYPAPVQHPLSDAATQRAKTLVFDGDKNLKIPACASCHGAKLTGVEPVVPGLLGLPRDYLTAQLGAWQTDLRHAREPDCMQSIVQRFAANDVVAVAGWLASQPVVNKGKPEASGSPDPSNSDLQCGSINDARAATGPKAEQESVPADSAPVKNSPAPVASKPLTAEQLNGRYLARLGNCAGCHTSQAGQDLSGGVAIRTPFGKIYGPNITADSAHGLGQWTAQEFAHAMRTGSRPDGTVLTPAFPWQFYQGLTQQDLADLHQWLNTVAPSPAPSRVHELEFPYGSQWALKAWRWFFTETRDAARPVPAMPPSSERGEYLVNNLLHCAACHGARNWFGAFSNEEQLGGQLLAEDAGYAPSLGKPDETGLGSWSLDEIKSFLLTGANRHAEASGLMTQVIQESTQYLRDDDASSVAMYLQKTAREGNSAASAEAAISAGATNKLYEEHCADCHGADGQGKPDFAPPLAGRASLALKEPGNVVSMILYGGFGAATQGRPYPPGMPGFAHRLRDAEVAELAGYVRRAWGNQGERVPANEIQRWR